MQKKFMPMSETNQSEAGKSVMEMVVVFMIIAIVLAFALPAVSNSINSYNVRSAADHIAQRLTAARTLAMTKNKEVTVSFNNSSGLYGYDFTPASAPDGVPDTSDPDDPGAGYLVESPSGGTRIVFPDSNNILVSFNSRGEMPIGATDKTIQISNSTNTGTVHINLRGKVWVTMP